MKEHMAKMLFKDIMQDSRADSKQFKTATGSPILYTRLKKHKGIYYPLNKHHLNMKSKQRRNHKHMCIVNSKIYGREVYGNVDIWPDDEIAREKLLQKLQTIENEAEDDDDDDYYDDDNDVGIDIPQGTDEVATECAISPETVNSAESCPKTKPPDEKRHVTITLTDTTDGGSPTSGEKQIHPCPPDPSSPPEGEGEWPQRRSQSINSRDNPFLPGGSLSLEADEILSKATIIRDRFLLELNNPNKYGSEQSGQRSNSPKSSPGETKSQVRENNCVSQSPVNEVNECMTKSEVANNECVAVRNDSPKKAKHKENGQVETDNSVTPVSVTLDIPEDSKDKKKQKKCCAVM